MVCLYLLYTVAIATAASAFFSQVKSDASSVSTSKASIWAHLNKEMYGTEIHKFKAKEVELAFLIHVAYCGFLFFKLHYPFQLKLKGVVLRWLGKR